MILNSAKLFENALKRVNQAFDRCYLVLGSERPSLIVGNNFPVYESEREIPDTAIKLQQWATPPGFRVLIEAFLENEHQPVHTDRLLDHPPMDGRFFS